MSPSNKTFGRAVYDALSSYWLCCVLLLALFVLTVKGTLHQVDFGLHDAKQVYFHSWFLWFNDSIPIFPGGLTCMGLLSLNLLLGGFVRIQWRARNAGVLIVHLGIVALLASGMTKIVTADEGHLSIVEGDSQDFFESYTEWEVAIWELNKPTATQEYVIGHELIDDLDGSRRTFTFPDLPFELVLEDFLPNCAPMPVGPNWTPDSREIEGYALLAKAKELEAERNDGGLVASVTTDGQTQEALLWGLQRQPWAIQVGERIFAIDMRHERYPMPFAIRLNDFIKDEHPGMSMAKSYRSKVTQVTPTGGERDVLIQMNEPLREGGVVLFQSSFGNTRGGREYSVFSVVRNPSDKWPEYSMWVITVGMVMAFGRTLLGFIRKQNQRRQKAAGAAR